MKRITDDLRKELKKPLGKIYRELKDMDLRADSTVTVGDRVTQDFIKSGEIPRMAVVDGMIERKRTNIKFEGFQKKIKVANKRSTISDDAIDAIKEAFQKDLKTIIEVDGEEDLLTLAVIKEAPIGYKVIYGQPREGAVLVEVTDKEKKKVIDIISRMEDCYEG